MVANQAPVAKSVPMPSAAPSAPTGIVKSSNVNRALPAVTAARTASPAKCVLKASPSMLTKCVTRSAAMEYASFFPVMMATTKAVMAAVPPARSKTVSSARVGLPAPLTPAQARSPVPLALSQADKATTTVRSS